MKIWSILFKMLSIGAIAAAASLWVDAGTDDRPKCRDQQTLIGGMIWSQLIILTGLLVSMVIGEKIHVLIHAYFLIAGVVLSFLTGIVLLIDELRALIIRRREMRSVSREMNLIIIENLNTKIYVSIGFISLVAAAFILADLIVTIIS